MGGESKASHSEEATHARILRCAIYPRKSTEEGLNQEFNTLEAQREASEAYIRSQLHAGWTALGRGMTTEDIPVRIWNVPRCENCWQTSRPVRSIAFWFTRLTGSVDPCWTLRG